MPSTRTSVCALPAAHEERLRLPRAAHRSQLDAGAPLQQLAQGNRSCGFDVLARNERDVTQRRLRRDGAAGRYQDGFGGRLECDLRLRLCPKRGESGQAGDAEGLHAWFLEARRASPQAAGWVRADSVSGLAKNLSLTVAGAAPAFHRLPVHPFAGAMINDFQKSGLRIDAPCLFHIG